VDVERTVLVAGDDAFEGLGHHVRHLPQLVAVAGHERPGVVDHEHGIVCHVHLVSTAHGHAAGAKARASDHSSTALAQGAHRVVDGNTIEEIAAHGVEMHLYIRHTVIDLFQVTDEVARGNTPETNLAVNVDLDGFSGS